MKMPFTSFLKVGFFKGQQIFGRKHVKLQVDSLRYTATSSGIGCSSSDNTCPHCISPLHLPCLLSGVEQAGNDFVKTAHARYRSNTSLEIVLLLIDILYPYMGCSPIQLVCHPPQYTGLSQCLATAEDQSSWKAQQS